MIFYTTIGWLLQGFRGYAYGPIAFIHKDFKDDASLRIHEKVHIKQFWKTLGLHPVLYWLSDSYRLRAEREAYTKQGNLTEKQIEKCLIKRYGKL